jgi:hypothetical protein
VPPGTRAANVTDNGIGFEGKIFQVFLRLHSRNEFARTGIGLAISERVVTNQGQRPTGPGRYVQHLPPSIRIDITFTLYLTCFV